MSAAARRLRRAVAGILFLLATLPAAAHAHALVEKTTPAAGAGVGRSPAAVTVRFNEPVEAPAGALRVIDARGRSVESGRTFHPGGDGTTVAVRVPRLPHGTYTATYLVVSADSHPVSGGFTFGIGAAPAAASAFGGSVAALVRERTAGSVTATAFSVVRAVQYTAIALTGGALAFLLLCWLPGLATVAGAGGAWARASQAYAARTRLIVTVASAAGLVSAVFAILLEGAQTYGTSLWGAASARVLADVFATRFGTIWEIALVCWLFIGLAGVTRIANVPVLRPASVGATGLALPASDSSFSLIGIPLLALCLLPSLAGHTSVDPPVAVLLPANLLHVAAMAVWLGGIATLVIAVRAALRPLEPADRTRLLVAVVPRFSLIAGAAFAAILLSGLLQALLEIPRVSALWDTAYGRAVLIKVALFALLVGLGWVNRSRSLPGLRAPDRSESAARLLRRTLTAELGLGIAVIAVTGALAGYAPDPEPLVGTAAAQGATGPLSRVATVGPARLRVTLPRTTPGEQRMQLALTDRRTGAPFTRAKEVRATAQLPGKIAPLTLDVKPGGKGRYVAQGALAVAGNWRLTVTVRVSAFDEYAATVSLPIHR